MSSSKQLGYLVDVTSEVSWGSIFIYVCIIENQFAKYLFQ